MAERQTDDHGHGGSAGEKFVKSVLGSRNKVIAVVFAVIFIIALIAKYSG